MKNILFSHSYFYKLDAKQWRFRQPYPPLGTIQAAAVVRESGFEVSLFDTNLRNGPAEIKPVLSEVKPDCLVIYDDGFNYLTKMCLTNMRKAALEMARHACELNIPVVICSSDSTDNHEMYLREGVDYVIRGEGEDSLLELLGCLATGGLPNSVANVAFRHGDELIVNEKRPVMKDLDLLPLPAWDLVEIEKYRDIWMSAHGYFSLNIATTRGCPYKCNWCAKPIYGNRYNARTPAHVIREIELLLTLYQPDHFWFCDDIFGLKPGWISEFSRLVEMKELYFTYKIQSRVDLLEDRESIKQLKRSGLTKVWLGAESGSQKILDEMDKGTTTEQIYSATRQLKLQDIEVGHFLQFGYPGETMTDINKTINMVLELMPDEIGISVSYPLPGTKFYEKVRSELKEKANWSDSDDLSLMFKNTYRSSFYKNLHRYVHNRYCVQRGLNQLKWPFSFGVRELWKLLSMIYNMPQLLVHGYRMRKSMQA